MQTGKSLTRVAGRSRFNNLTACLRGEIPVGIDLLPVVQDANNMLVTPTLHDAIVDHHAYAEIPSDIRAYIRLVRHLNSERNSHLKTQAIAAIRSLNDVGIEPLVIKGAASLLTESSERLGLRMMADLDFVIDPNDLSRGTAALLRAGYHFSFEDEGSHACATLYRPEDAGCIDLHHRLPGPAGILEQLDLVDAEEWVEIDGVRARIPSATARVAHLVIHDMIHDRRLRAGTMDLRHLLDVSTLIRAGASIDWKALSAGFRSNTMLTLSFEVYMMSLREFLHIRPTSHLEGGRIARALFLRIALKADNGPFRKLDDLAIPVARFGWTLLKAVGPRRWSGRVAAGLW